MSPDMERHVPNVPFPLPLFDPLLILNYLIMRTFMKITTGCFLMVSLFSCETEDNHLYDGVSKEKIVIPETELNAADDSLIRLPSGGA